MVHTQRQSLTNRSVDKESIISHCCVHSYCAIIHFKFHYQCLLPYFYSLSGITKAERISKNAHYKMDSWTLWFQLDSFRIHNFLDIVRKIQQFSHPNSVFQMGIMVLSQESLSFSSQSIEWLPLVAQYSIESEYHRITYHLVQSRGIVKSMVYQCSLEQQYVVAVEVVVVVVGRGTTEIANSTEMGFSRFFGF